MTWKSILPALFILFLAGCEEVAPVITGAREQENPGPDLEGQQRQVLIEEFTGVKCVNCPAGSQEIETLLSIHGQQLVAVSIHAGEFAPPYQESVYDFRTQEGEQVLSYLGEPFGYPTAVVNRRKFDGQFDLQLGKGEWAGYIEEEKALPPKVRIGIERGFNPASRRLDIDVTLLVDEDITADDIRLSIMVTESGIKDLQLTPASSQPKADYVHKHVLRGMVTPYDGVGITENLTAGTLLVKSFSYEVPASWVAENCEILAFVSLFGDQKDVLQAQQIHMVE
ncbi:MAG: hypothetical protein RI973_730 [Bacteroidota bacterium]|jgi:hypothetical protein